MVLNSDAAAVKYLIDLRDNIANLELVLNMLAEAIAAEISKQKKGIVPKQALFRTILNTETLV